MMAQVMAEENGLTSSVLLHVAPSDGASFDHAVKDESFVIGRSSKADLTIPDRSMSRMHARIFLNEGAWYVEDLGSRNGTLLGGRQVESPAQVGHGSIMQVGSTSVTFRDANQSGGSPSRPVTTPSSHTIFRSAADLLKEPEDIRSDSGTPVAESLRRYADRLHLLTEVNRAMDGTMSLGDLLEFILDRAFITSVLKRQPFISATKTAISNGRRADRSENRIARSCSQKVFCNKWWRRVRQHWSSTRRPTSVSTRR